MAVEKWGSGQGFWPDGQAQWPARAALWARVLLDLHEHPWLILRCFGPYGRCLDPYCRALD